MNCPKCSKLGFDDRKDIPMEEKGFIEQGSCEDGCCPYGKTIYQCPECKNIEVA